MRVIYDGMRPQGVGSLMRVGDFDIGSPVVGIGMLAIIALCAGGIYLLTRGGK